MKRIQSLIVALVAFAPALALAADISGYWHGWSCGVEDTYSCPAQTGYYDNYSSIHFASDPKTMTNYASWAYSGFTCSSVLTYVSDIGSGVAGSYHYWQFTDTPQAGSICIPGTVVVAVKVGTNEPIQVWWYAENPAYSESNTFGYLTRYSRQ